MSLQQHRNLQEATVLQVKINAAGPDQTQPYVASHSPTQTLAHAEPHLLDNPHADVAEVAPHHCAPYMWVDIAGPEIQRINVWNAPGPKHEPAVGSQ
jgi:hypothetical protein